MSTIQLKIYESKTERLLNSFRFTVRTKPESRLLWFFLLYTASLLGVISVGGSMRILLTYF